MHFLLILYGFSKDFVWNLYRFPIHFLWIYYGFSMDFVWIPDGFCMNSDGFGHHFLKDLIHFSAAAFAECQRRLARNEITENVKNMQITAEICKNQTQNAISCNKTPIFKIGGGGARAARRIRIHRTCVCV